MLQGAARRNSAMYLCIMWFLIYNPDGALFQYNEKSFFCKTKLTLVLAGKENIILHKKVSI